MDYVVQCYKWANKSVYTKKRQNSCVHRIDTNGRAVHWAQAECVFHKSQVKVCYEKCAIKGESKKT